MNHGRYIKDFVITVNRIKREEFTGTRGEKGFRQVADGVDSFTITVDVDMEGIAHQLGSRAVRNRSKKSKYLGGFVQVEATKRESWKKV